MQFRKMSGTSFEKYMKHIHIGHFRGECATYWEKVPQFTLLQYNHQQLYSKMKGYRDT